MEEKTKKRKSMYGFDDRYWISPSTDHRRYEKINSSSATAEPDGVKLNFGLQVAKHVLLHNLTTTTDVGKSAMCSPVSIAAVLNVLAAGATGDTLAQLLRLLECDDVEEVNSAAANLAEVFKRSDDEDAPEVSFANGLWVSHRLRMKPPFEKVLADVHNTRAKAVDFVNQAEQVVKEANLWAEEQSKGMIKQILSRDSITKETKMILANALYFKGTWAKTFEPRDTTKEDFYLLNGGTVKAPFMTQTYKSYDYGEFEDCKVLRMLYLEEETVKDEKARSFSMYIFLPNKKNGLLNLMKKIKMDANMFKDRVKLKYERINKLSIPKFSFDCDVSLKEPMKQLGLTLPFKESCQELSEMVEDPSGDWPYVDDILQKCRIETDEKGTKAAAIVLVNMRGGGGPPPPPPIEYVADHPFMFMIREDISGAILFVGTVLNPLQT